VTAANWITLIVPILGILGGGLVYILQRHIDRENEIKRERRELYRKAAVALERVHQELRRNEPNKAEQNTVIEELEVIIAEIQVATPDSVAGVWVEIPSLVADLQGHQHSSKADLQAFTKAIKAYEKVRAEALLAMRRDTYGQTKITLELIADALAQMSGIVAGRPFS
jgi:hypothetical protein